jgi:hypothetical protein
MPAAVRAALAADPDSPPAKQAWLDALPLAAPASTVATVAPGARGMISIVLCSVDDARYAAATRSYAHALADWAHEFVRIADATGLAEGYRRGLARARGEIVAFSHDDVEILPADFGHRLAATLAVADIAGVAGASRAAGPAWPHAGHPHLHGCVVYPDATGYRVSVYSRQVPIATGIRVLDGVFLAMPRTLAREVGWDALACPGFHGYDIDFSLRAAQRGLRLAAASNLGIVHRSLGGFGPEWKAAAERLVARYPELAGPRSPATFFHARTVRDASRALALIDAWCAPAVPE